MATKSLDREAAEAKADPAALNLYDGLLLFSGREDEYAALTLSAALATGMMRQGVIFRWDGADGAPAIAGALPPIANDSPPKWFVSVLAAMGDMVAPAMTRILPAPPGEAGAAPGLRGVKPLAAEDGVYFAFETTHADPARMAAFSTALELFAALWRSYRKRVAGDAAADAAVFAPAIAILSTVGVANRFRAFAMTLCNELASRFACDRVSLGLLRGRYVRVAAMSNTEKIGKGMELVQCIEAAMEECLDQDVEVVYPDVFGQSHVSRAAGELSRRFDSGCVLSLPVRRDGRPFAVLTLERAAAAPPDARDVRLLRLVAELAAPRLHGLERHDRWFGARLLRWTREKLSRLLGADHTWAKLAALACLAAALALAMATGSYRVEASFVTQPVTQRVIAVPYDGFIAAVHTRPGERVEAGATRMASLETAAVRSRLAMKQAEKISHEKDAALGRRDGKLAEAQAAEARADQAAAEIALLAAEIDQADIYSPLSGVVLFGDLTTRVGAPVKQGDTLFEVAPLGRMEADLFVPEDEIADVRVGQSGELATAGRPDERIRFRVVRITPMAEMLKQKNVFRVQAELLEPPEWMLPGLEGVAKIDVEERPLLAIWSRRAANWVKMKLWTWWLW